MAMRISTAAQKIMAEQGLVPSNCSQVEILIPAHGPMVLRYEVWVNAEQLQKLSVVFQAMALEP